MKTILYQPLFINPYNYFGYTIGIQKANYYNKPYKLKFNFNKEIDDINFSVVSTDGNLITTQCFSAIINNGSVVDVPIISEEIFNNQKEPNIYYDFGTNKDIEIDVELIPVENKNKNYNINIYNLKNFINDIEITDYNLLFDTYENKVWENGVILNDGLLQRNCTSIVPLDRNNNIYTNTNGNADVVFFDKDGKYISTLNFYNNKPVLKENFPENAELVAFTYYRDSVITDKFFASAKNNYNLKLCQSTILKKKGTRPVVNINLSDSEEEIFLKLASAYITQDCDVYFETGEYTFIKIFDLMNTKYDFRTAVELPIGGNCRYFFNKSTLISKCDSTSEIVYSNQSLFGTQRIGFNSNYELHDGHLIQYDNIYAIHDEGSGEDSYYKHVYDNLIVEYIKGEHTQYLSKPLGCGSNLHMDIIIKNCIFKNGKENVSDVSWHFVDNANCKFTITGNRFNYRFSFDSDVTKCNVLFTNNSHKEDNVFANATVMQFNNVKE